MYNIKNNVLFSSTQRLFVKGYRFLSFAKNMGKIIGKNIGKNLSGIYSQKPLEYDKNLQQMHLKL